MKNQAQTMILLDRSSSSWLLTCCVAAGRQLHAHLPQHYDGAGARQARGAHRQMHRCRAVVGAPQAESGEDIVRTACRVGGDERIDYLSCTLR